MRKDSGRVEPESRAGMNSAGTASDRPADAGAGVQDQEMADLKRRVRRLAWLMDESVRLPGGFRVGLDGVIGLIPGVGDLAGAAVSGYAIYEARRIGVPLGIVLRMMTNVLIEAVIGAIPLLGDLFDFYFKANLRNLALLERYQASPRPTERLSWLRILLYGLLLIAIPALLITILILMIRALLGLFS